MCLPYDIHRNYTAKHLVLLNLPIFKPLYGQWTNCPANTDLPRRYTSVSLFNYKERGYVVRDTWLVHLLKFREPYPPIFLESSTKNELTMQLQ